MSIIKIKLTKIRRKEIILMGILALSFYILISSMSNVNAFDFYNGPIKISMINVNVIVDNGVAYINTTYKFINGDSNLRTLNLTFDDYPDALVSDNVIADSLSIEGQGIAYVNVFAKKNIGTGGVFSLDPEVLIDGNVPSERLDSFVVNVNINNKNMNIIGSNLDFNENNNINGPSYYYSANDIYPKLISFKVINSDPHIYVYRTNSDVSSIGDQIVISTTIQNYGNQKLNNITLEDSFLESNFYTPENNGFKLVTGTTDPYYIWSDKIDSLNPGESKTISYSLNVNSFVNLRLNPLRVFVNGILIASVDGKPLQQSSNQAAAIILQNNFMSQVTGNFQNVPPKEDMPKDVNWTELGKETMNYKKAISQFEFLVLVIFVLIIITIIIFYRYVKKQKTRGYK